MILKSLRLNLIQKLRRNDYNNIYIFLHFRKLSEVLITYSTGKKYKIKMKDSICYTALILEEDSISLKIKDRAGESIILNKDNIHKSMLLEQDSESGVNV